MLRPWLLPMRTSCYLDKDENEKPVEITKYKGCKVDRKGTSGACLLFGSSLISWYSKKKCKYENTSFIIFQRILYNIQGDCHIEFIEIHIQLADIFTKVYLRKFSFTLEEN
ncbi:hypothetical protein CR513_43666, partial [Mucuna pruriens]